MSEEWGQVFGAKNGVRSSARMSRTFAGTSLTCCQIYDLRRLQKAIPSDQRRPDPDPALSYAAPLVAGVVARLQEVMGPLSADQAWALVRDSASFAPAPLDATGNRRIAHRGLVTCYP